MGFFMSYIRTRGVCNEHADTHRRRRRGGGVISGKLRTKRYTEGPATAEGGGTERRVRGGVFFFLLILARAWGSPLCRGALISITCGVCLLNLHGAHNADVHIFPVLSRGQQFILPTACRDPLRSPSGPPRAYRRCAARTHTPESGVCVRTLALVYARACVCARVCGHGEFIEH